MVKNPGHHKQIPGKATGVAWLLDEKANNINTWCRSSGAGHENGYFAGESNAGLRPKTR
jgi:hypothetical protein